MSVVFVRRSYCHYGLKYLNSFFKNSYPGKYKWSQKCFLHTTLLRNVIGQEIKMPSLSPTMTEGRIVKWFKKEGDSVKPGDLLCEIQTDKAIMAFETEEEGVIAKILVREDSDIKVGKLIALLVAEGEDWNKVEVPGTANILAERQVESVLQVPSSEQVTGTEIKMPSLSPTMTDGTIIKWLKNEGDKISPGDGLCEVQTDKAVMVFETEEEGILAKILVPNNTPEVKVGTLIALIVEEGENWKNVVTPNVHLLEKENLKDEDVVKKTTIITDTIPKSWPAVRLLIEKYQLDYNTIEPSGRKGKLLKKDVLKFISDNRLSPKPIVQVPAPTTKTKEVTAKSEPLPLGDLSKPKSAYTDIEVSGIRRTIANRLTQSKTEIPHAYSVVDARVDELLKTRAALKSGGIAVSVNDFVIKAVAAGLKEYPFINALFSNNQATVAPYIDISVAVATPNGLITPIIKSADNKSVIQIAEEIRGLAERARRGNLQLHEFQGGTFTISNLGMFGIREFSAIINPPQCGILAVGCSRSVLLANGKIANMMSCTLSFDERTTDQLGAAQFLNAVQYYLETPSLLLLSQTRKLMASA